MFQTNRNRDGLLYAAENGGLFGVPAANSNLEKGISAYLNIDHNRSSGRNVVLVIASRFNTPQVSQTLLTQLITRQPPITVVTVSNDNTADANTVGNAFRFQIPLASYRPLPILSSQTVGSIINQFPVICRGQAPVPTC